MFVSAADLAFLRLAEREARAGLGRTRPNPPVGAIVVSNGEIIGRGYHARCGEAHAEAAALASCRAPTEGACVYVSLEPCSKPGRVGACCEALAAAKVARVVWAANDPNPVNAGRAREVLAAYGIEGVGLAEAEVAPELLAERNDIALEAAELVAPFAKRILSSLPYLTVKLAVSLDGRISDCAGRAKWISSADSRERTGRLREIADAMMVGAETVRKDNPSLLARPVANPCLHRVVVARGELPAEAKIFTDEAADRTIVFRSPASLREVMADLGERGFMHIVCEGGLSLARALAAEGLVDEWIEAVAPIVIGDGPLEKALRFEGDDQILFRRGAHGASLAERMMLEQRGEKG